ncbi:hypothetical protein RJ639_002927 [Escallonia herrerae]|uniref:non-specific serine/threonine protein kinase n=1 Tax=Escallonia herrerae TaxID=1293975 RepID=A0AA88W1U6_9ASTE|nr:hypothetical protein RJ639_002927 [Escallonia herrerae]
MDVSANSLEGSIPLGLGSCMAMNTLDLSFNSFSGGIPPGLGNCSSLSRFAAVSCGLSGPIPSSFGQLSKLTSLRLSENRLSGKIPPELGKCRSLRDMQLDENQLEGNIPREIGMLSKLRNLSLFTNHLTGEIPLHIWKIQSLEILFVYNNNLSGEISSEITELKHLRNISLFNNQFSDVIPQNLGINSSLTAVDFNNNSFTGQIPPNLCFRKQLQRLILGLNYLEGGDIPSLSGSDGALENMKMLNLSGNGLTGPVPAQRPEKEGEKSAEFEGASLLLNKIMEATENLNEKYIIGRGSHGTVYKASLGPDKVFAVKKLLFTGLRGGDTSMVREIQTVGKVKHRNLCKLHEFWFRKDYGLILYSYMQNGSLHDVLHEIYPPPTLEWNTRYRIALGTAQDLAYLHFDCDPSIVHRDIKPKNILLDADIHLTSQILALPSFWISLQLRYLVALFREQSDISLHESDVYSYGVVLLELITRKTALDPSFSEEADIVGWAWSLWSKSKEIEMIVDPNLLGEFIDSSIMQQVTDVLLVALRCTEKEASRRPSMRDVIRRLEDANATARS